MEIPSLTYFLLYQGKIKQRGSSTKIMAMEGSLSPSERTKPILDDSNGVVVRLVKEQPPQHCILKVESFSIVQDTLCHSVKNFISSAEFKAGGYTWVLYVYPKGNKQEDGDGHLSLYVALVDKLESGTSVNVALRFFIYDQIRDNYLAFIDIRDKCFNVLKTTWGIPNLMPLESFTDTSNGFLVNDCCVFGAEVLVKNGQVKISTLSLLEPECDRIYTWKIEKFSELDEELYSPIFCFGEWSWKLSLYPRGDGVGKGKCLSLFLLLVNPYDLTHGSKLYTQFSLGIKNQGKGADHKEIVCQPFCSEIPSWGYPSFLSISDVFNNSKRFLLNDTLIVEAKIEVMLLLNDTDELIPKKSISSVFCV